jgi:hypothetical protein
MTTRAPIILPPALALLGLQPRWVIWKWVIGKNGKPTKPPFRADAPSLHASSTDPATWSPVDTAMLAYNEGKCDGIGFALQGSGIAAFDIDHCRDATTGAIHPWAQDLIRRSGSYAEVTPSGAGVRIIGLGNGAPLHRKFAVPNANGMSCELYRKADRFITITGDQIGDATALADIDALLDETFAELEDAKQKQEKPRTEGAENKTAGHKHDLDSLIKDGCGEDFGGDRSRAVWYVANQLLKQGRSKDETEAVLLDRSNGISAHIYDQSNPEEYARKQVEKAQKEQANDPDLEIARLAKLSALQYEQERKAAAEKLDIRASILDKVVAAERDKLGLDGDDGKQGHAIEFPEPEPWPEPVDGVKLLNGIAAAIRRHVVLADHVRDASASWVTHSYLLDHAMITPRLAIKSPVKGCGKTTLLDVIGQLVYRPLPAANCSASSIFRVVESHRPCLLIDEADAFLPDNEELRGVLNSGHRRGGAVLRNVGDDHEPRSFSTYAACAIALIGELPGTLADRSVTINLIRRKANEPVEPFRFDRVEHLAVLARKLARWTKDNAEAVATCEPEMPAGLYNRAADNWRCLLSIATVAGGDWLGRGHRAALQGTGGNIDEASRLELLLGDVRAVFDGLKTDVDRISSAHLIEKLVGIVPRPWAEYGRSGKPLTQNKLARLPAGHCASGYPHQHRDPEWLLPPPVRRSLCTLPFTTGGSQTSTTQQGRWNGHKWQFSNLNKGERVEL